ncbi:hypothetical protein HID58_031697 [Brassica napus]|uniref:Uncharacterized protein n=1 Tax=Brassica napus TaxID=3708 RepID=A0ABQ8BW05_BRANA|nr:hypothetical protein HID58_031697 [Brassica napus]
MVMKHQDSTRDEPASFFAAVYVTKSKEFFPQTKLEFSSKVVMCACAKNVYRMETTGGDGIVGLVLGCLDERHREWHDAFDIHNFAM